MNDTFKDSTGLLCTSYMKSRAIKSDIYVVVHALCCIRDDCHWFSVLSEYRLHIYHRFYILLLYTNLTTSNRHCCLPSFGASACDWCYSYWLRIPFRSHLECFGHSAVPYMIFRLETTINSLKVGCTQITRKSSMFV